MRRPMRSGLIRRRAAETKVRAHFARLRHGRYRSQRRGARRSISPSGRRSKSPARSFASRESCCSTSRPRRCRGAMSTGWARSSRREKAKGATIVFISHRLREVRRFCDTLTILRNGRHIATGRVADLSDDEVIAHDHRPLARPDLPAAPAGQRAPWPRGAPRSKGSARPASSRDATFVLRAGEILGIAGLQGMGQLDLFLACFGMIATKTGNRRCRRQAGGDRLARRCGARQYRHQPRARGSQDRGAVPQALAASTMLRMPVIDRFSRFGLIDGERENAAVARCFDRVEVADRALWTRVGGLLRRQPAEDRHRQMAAGGKPHPAALRSDARHRCRHQA